MFVPSDSALPVLAVTGLAKEARLATGPGVVAVGAGGNPQRLRALLAERVAPGCRAVLSFGIAGGLGPDLKPGDVVIASAIVMNGMRYDVDAEVSDRLLRRLTEAGVSARLAPLAASETAILGVADKASLHARTGAAAVDMESHVAGAFATQHRLPFVALRVVCDPADRAIPAFAAAALKPNGEPDIVAILRAVASEPRQIGGLLRLARDSGRAFASLARCRKLLGEGFGLSLEHQSEKVGAGGNPSLP